jgi:hypothetical protein
MVGDSAQACTDFKSLHPMALERVTDSQAENG